MASINPVAGVIVGLGALGMIVAIRGTQDNFLSALTGHEVASASTSAPATYPNAKIQVPGLPKAPPPPGTNIQHIPGTNVPLPWGI